MAGRGRPKKDKDPYEGLSEEWRAAVESGDRELINQKLSEAGLEQQQVLDDMEADQDYQNAKLAAKFAGEGYKERRKVVKLKFKFAKRVLESRGSV